MNVELGPSDRSLPSKATDADPANEVRIRQSGMRQ